MTNPGHSRAGSDELREQPAVGQVEVRPASGHIGAEIAGVDLSRALSPEQVAEIRSALHVVVASMRALAGGVVVAEQHVFVPRTFF